MKELKPCPFCGGEAVQRDFTEPFVNGWVGCQKCHCFINWVKGGKPEAVAVWNRRIAPENKVPEESCGDCFYEDKFTTESPCSSCIKNPRYDFLHDAYARKPEGSGNV